MRKIGFAIATLAVAAMMTSPVLAATDLTVFNSKSEIQTQFEEEAAVYSEEKGVNMEVAMSNDPVITHMGTRYSSNNPYVLAMVDAKDVYSLTPEHGIDLADLDAAADTDLLKHGERYLSGERTFISRVHVLGSHSHWSPFKGLCECPELGIRRSYSNVCRKICGHQAFDLFSKCQGFRPVLIHLPVSADKLSSHSNDPL